jgi:poly(A) polymerase
MKKIRMEIRAILQENAVQPVRMKFNIELPADILKIKDILKGAGFKLYVVGGAVRDAILGKEPKDFDLATDAVPDKVQELLRNSYKTLETGKAFGVINVLTPTGEYEVATFRKDLGKGRRPDAVEFTTIDQDVLRRDLTINALFYDIDAHEVVDLIGGIEDLKNGIVKTVGSPEERFDEDRLRILRAIRFAGRFGSELDAQTDAALKKDASLEGISPERIRDEFLKGIKSARSVIHFLNLLGKYKLFDWIFKGISIKKDFIEERNPTILIAFMFRDSDPTQVKNRLHNLTYTSDEVGKIIFLLKLLHLSVENAFQMKRTEVNAKVSHEEMKKFFMLNHKDIKLIDAFIKFTLSVTGQDVMALGLKGADVGREMERQETEKFKTILGI